MFNNQLFINRDQAFNTGKKLKASGNNLALAKVTNNLIQIVNRKLNIIQHNISLYEAFISSYQNEAKPNE